MPQYRSRTSTAGRNMAGIRSLWRATGMKDEDFWQTHADREPLLLKAGRQIVENAKRYYEQDDAMGGSTNTILHLLAAAHPNITWKMFTGPAGSWQRPCRPGISCAARRRTWWQPLEARPRKVSAALKAYALLATSADKGAVRDLEKLR